MSPTLAGPHIFVVQKGNTSGAYSRLQTEELQLEEGKDVSLSIVRPVVLEEPVSTSATQVHLRWERSNDPDFRQYHVRVGVSEQESHFYFVRDIEDVNQTQTVATNEFRQNIFANRDHYFRVYVYRGAHSLASSNVLKVRTPAWDNAHQLTTFYRLEPVTKFTGAAPIHGLTWDGQYLWLLYGREPESEFAPNLSLVQYDHTLQRALRTLPFWDSSVPGGLTWDGEKLRVSSPSAYRLQRRNPDTGNFEDSIEVEWGTRGLTWTGSSLILNRSSAKTVAVDPATGGLQREIPNPFHRLMSSVNTDVAYRPGELWMANAELSDIAIVNDAGQHIGAARSPYTLLHMEFIGPELLAGVTGDGQVHMLRAVPGP